MPNLGFGELFTIVGTLVFLFIALSVLRRVSKVEAWVAARRAKRALFYERRTAAEGTRDTSARRSGSVLPFALRALSGATLVMGAAFFASLAGVTFAWLLPIAVLVAGILFVAGGLVRHFTPGASRRRKYELLVAGVGMLTLGFFDKIAGFFIRGFADDAGTAILIVIVAYSSPLILLLVANRIAHTWLWPMSSDGNVGDPTFSMRRSYRRMMSQGYGIAIFSFAAVVHPFLLVYLVLRYALVERMAEHPILYLRSFRHVEGPTVFGRVVMRVAPRYGVVAALAHDTQSEPTLQAETRLTERPKLARVKDSDWQLWVEKELRGCSAAIIDRTGGTEGVAWELDRALQLVPRSQIIILQQKGLECGIVQDVVCLEYELGGKQEESSRKALDSHLRRLLLEPSPTNSMALEEARH